MKPLLLILPLLIAAPAWPGPHPELPELPEDPPDFSAAYARFYEYGLEPLPDNAFPVSIVGFMDERRIRGNLPHPLYRVLPLFAWETDSGNLKLMSGDHVINTRGHLVSTPWEKSSPSDERLAVRRTEDLDVIFQDLFENSIARPNPFRGPVPVSTWIILAVRLHELGYTRHANQLTAWLFAQYGREAVLRLTVSDLISMQYARLHQRVLQDQDLNRFILEVEQLLEDFGAIWLVADKIRETAAIWKASLEFDPKIEFADRPEMAELLEILRQATTRAARDSDLLSFDRGQLIINLLNHKVHENGLPDPEKETTPFERLVQTYDLEILPMLLELAEMPVIFPLENLQTASPFGTDPFKQQQDLARTLRTMQETVHVFLVRELPGLNDFSSMEDSRRRATELYEKWREMEPRGRVLDYIPMMDYFVTLPPELPEAWARSSDPEIHAALRKRLLHHPIDLFRLPASVLDSPVIQGEENAAYRETLAIELELAAIQDRTHPAFNRMLLKLGQLPENVEILSIETLLDRFLNEQVDYGLSETVLKLENGLILLDPETSAPAHVQRVLLTRLAESTGPELELLQQYAMRILLTTPRMTHVPVGQRIWPLKEAWLPLLDREADPEIGPAPADVAKILLRTNRPAHAEVRPIITNLEVTEGKEAADAFRVRMARNYLEEGIFIPPLPHRKAWEEILRHGSLASVTELLETPDPMLHLLLRSVIRTQPYFFQREELSPSLSDARRTLQWLHGDFPDGFPQVPAGTRINQGHLQDWVDWAHARAEEGEAGVIILTSSLFKPGLGLRHTELSFPSYQGITFNIENGRRFNVRLDQTLDLNHLTPHLRPTPRKSRRDEEARLLQYWLEGNTLPWGDPDGISITYRPQDITR